MMVFALVLAKDKCPPTGLLIGSSGVTKNRLV